MGVMSELDLSPSFTSGQVSPQYQQAVSLHRAIMANAQTAADAMIEFCKSLKEMRDSKLYEQLGYDSFEDYTVQAVGLKQRQAYNYISTYEKLGQSFLQSNATLGIVKLELLAHVPAIDRQDVTEENDLDGMSVPEVRELVAKYNQVQEQLSLISTQKSDTEDENEKLLEEIRELKNQLAALPPEDAESGEDGPDEADKAFDQYMDERNRLLARIKELEDSLDEPVEASEEAVEKIRAEEAEKASRDAAEKIKQAQKDAAAKIKAAKEKAKADADAAIKAAEEKASKAQADAEKRAQEIAKQRLEESLRDIEQEKAEAVARAAEIEKKLKVAANPHTMNLNFHLGEMQRQFTEVHEILINIAGSDPEAGDKFRGAVLKVLDAMKQQLSGEE